MRASGGARGPREVFIETTRACNLRCAHCAVSQPNYSGGTLSWEAFSRVVPFLRVHRPFVHLNGHGETLLCKRFPDMFEAVVAAGCLVGFQTNGVLLKPELTRRLLDVAGSGGLRYVCFSLDAAEKDLYERIRRGAEFETVCAHARFLSEEKGRRRLDLPLLKFEFVAMRMNAHQLPATVRLAARLGGGEFNVSDLIEYPGMEGQRLGHDLEYARPYFREAAEVAEEVGIRFMVMPVFNDLCRPSAPAKWNARVAASGKAEDSARQGPPSPSLSVIPPSSPDTVPPRRRGRRMIKACRDPWDVTFVQAGGEVMPCCILPLPMGSVAARTLDEIWGGPQYEALRRLVASLTPLPDCTTCIMRGWKPEGLRARLRHTLGRAAVAAGSRLGGADRDTRPNLEVGIKPDREAYRQGESCRGCLSVRVRGSGPGVLVDVYVVAMPPGGERLWATDRGLKSAPLPFLAAWEPFSFPRLDVFEHPVPRLSPGTRISLLAVAVPTGVAFDDEASWIASDSSAVNVCSETVPAGGQAL
ncbi:MAG: radical SAM protein [Thermoanaerobaculaceae bacterium]|nr:radical SAM protein [Thermoanaerobaculaceae bacterium]